ncbi:MAG: response regulator, partial [Bacteroidetes bacterium]|nr:response regulator [Bacteroidota bacterium]
MFHNVAILLIDDDEDDFLIIKGIIREITDRQYTLDWVSSYDQGLKDILARRHDVYLVDYRLGVRTGLELIKESIARGIGKPMILLTGQGTLQIDEQAMEAGAYDFIEKSTLNPHLLERAIRYSIRHAGDIHEIRKLNLDLERRVQERTQALAGVIKELQEANKNILKAKEEVSRSLAREKELNELKSRFVSTASHEFRTPLSAILSSINLIGRYSKPGDEEKRVRHINKIQSAVNNLQEILNDFLSLGKLEEGIVRNNPSLFDITEFSEGLTEEMQGLAKNEQNIIYQHL